MALVKRFVGNCQACAADHKTTPGGVIALHGYERPGLGYIKGRCDGSGQLAYELSRDLIPVIITFWRGKIEILEDTLRAIDADEVTSLSGEEYSPAERRLVPVTYLREALSSYDWRSKLRERRSRVARALEGTRKELAFFEDRYRTWVKKPLREIDEFGRTPEQRAAREKRETEQRVAKERKEDKAARIAYERGQKLVQRKSALDGAGKLIREAAARGDREGALAVLKELGKKKNRGLLDASFMDGPISRMKRQGKLPADLPDLGWDEKPYWWEKDLRADDALLRLGLAKHNDNLRGGIEFDTNLWHVW